jgi:ABC-type polysaccharide/polyol phosphate transport system ATPase subunit
MDFLMSSDFSIKVAGLSKCYKIYAKPYYRLKQMIVPRLKKCFGLLGEASSYGLDFWAVRDISFEIKRGETVGILGKNGSGKSTLLQLICGTLNPTSGLVNVNGRIAALLELGSGFNPDFTGRENVYLNGAICGFTKDQISKKFSEIEEFADIGDFINHPVKTYSSGMFVRLAFAVQIMLEPEILVIDEALAVGDAGFQLKCMMRMKRLQESGVTILFVSHDTGSMIRLCNRVILLDHGVIKADSANILEVVKMYDRITRNMPNLASDSEPTRFTIDYAKELGGITETRLGSNEASYHKVDFFDEDGDTRSVFEAGDFINISALIYSSRHFPSVVSGFTLKNKEGVDVWGDNTVFAGFDLALEPGYTNLSYRFKLNIPAGEYFLYVGLADVEGERMELDQRWPIRRLSVVSHRRILGYVHSPALISAEFQGE